MTPHAISEAAEAPMVRTTRWSQFRAVMRTDRKALVGSAILLVFVVAAILGPLIAPYDPNDMAYDFLAPPSWQHPLGTDDLGRDLLSRIIAGTQVSIFVGVSTVVIGL